MHPPDIDPPDTRAVLSACDAVLGATSVRFEGEVTATEPGSPSSFQRGVADPRSGRAALLTTVHLPDLPPIELPGVVDGDTLLQADADADAPAGTHTWTAIEDTGLGLLSTQLVMVWWCRGVGFVRPVPVDGADGGPGDDTTLWATLRPATAVDRAAAQDRDRVRRSLEAAQDGLLDPGTTLDAELGLRDGVLRSVTLTLPSGDGGMLPGPVPGATLRLRVTPSSEPAPIVVPTPATRTTVAGFVRDLLGEPPPE